MSTTPPPPDSSAVSFQPLLDTPRHIRGSTSNNVSSTPKHENRNSTLMHLAREMGPFFFGPMPVDKFLESFMPAQAPSPSAGAPQSKNDILRDYFSVLSQSETKWYNIFNNAINPHLKNLVVINTSSPSAGPTNNRFPLDLEPDCSVYTKDAKPEKAIFDFNHVEFVIEFKNKVDPFVEPASTSKSKEEPGPKSNPFLNLNSIRNEVLGQLTAYATAILSAQYRTHLFTILIVNSYARLIRWDRSGAVVTEPIHFDKDGRLVDFLMRYDNASREVRGHDSTVSVPSNNEIERAKESVTEWGETDTFLTVTVPHKDTEKRFIIPRPEARPNIPVGRWTRSSIAYDIQTDRRVYLKDSWRVLMEDIEPEGVIYDRLHKGNVPNIPPCLFAGDIGDNAHHQTQTQRHVTQEQGAHSYWDFNPYRHYRIVLGVVGRKLKDFTNSREMVSAMHAALKAHKGACDLLVLHRDISDRNILIVGSEELRGYESRVEGPKPNIDGGMLIDWDLSKNMNPKEPRGARQSSRTGTWLFMAADLVRNPDIEQKPVHDLESFFWVLLWMVVTQVKTNFDEIDLSSFVGRHFSPKRYKASTGRVIGGTAKKDFFTSDQLKLNKSGELDKSDLQTPGNIALSNLLVGLKDTVSSRHRTKPLQKGSMSDEDYARILKAIEDAEENSKLLKKDDHSRMLDRFVMALSKEWPNDDKASPRKLQLSVSEDHAYQYQAGEICI